MQIRNCDSEWIQEFRNSQALIRLQEEGIWSWSSKPPPTTQNRPQTKSSNRNVCIFGTQKIFKANIQHIWHTNVFNPNIFVQKCSSTLPRSNICLLSLVTPHQLTMLHTRITHKYFFLKFAYFFRWIFLHFSPSILINGCYPPTSSPCNTPG